MQLSRSNKPHDKIGYYLLPSGYADVFLHKNEKIETDEEGNAIYVSEEVYLKTKATKGEIEKNFDHYWNSAEKEPMQEPSAEERLQALEDALLFMLGGM